ncbi:c-type cytochrome [Comamonas composti]|uniref:c-type cytochrome n=1 Tax=Comamonas composti TaxID=408558 RepID=UPI000403074E|nr:c-type cytochrome [Comamonas composti]
MSDQAQKASQGSNVPEYIATACLYAVLGGALLYGITSSMPARKALLPKIEQGEKPRQARAGAQQQAAASALPVAFSPPGERDIPEGPMGEWIRRGEAIFMRTPANAVGFSGNSLSCANCHLDAGRLKGAAPMWGAYPMYPAYRKKTDHVDTFAERVRGCFMYSMNGKAPADGHDVLVAVEAYAYWMAQKAPTGEKLPGAGFAKVGQAEQEPSVERGAKVYEANCALCHGDKGQGQETGGVTVFPPLWGKQSYNWGAGMHEVDKAANFIKNNMPYGNPTLSDQEAWDVSLYINSMERPQDPRFTGNVAETRKQFHDSPYSMYGTQAHGQLLKGL